MLHALADVGHLEDLSSRWPLLLVFSHQFDHELLQLGAVVRWDRLWSILHNLEDQSEKVIRLEGLLQRAELVEDDAQGPHITLRRVRLALTVFGRHVIGSTNHCHRCCVGRFEDLADAEVAELDSLVTG